jgi:hypothetical protein
MLCLQRRHYDPSAERSEHSKRICAADHNAPDADGAAFRSSGGAVQPSGPAIATAHR